jgi:lipopolysaccharide biosynthesis glycosyltransferase
MNNDTKVITIVLASDNNYAIPLGITIFSILFNKSNNYTIDFFILENQIDKSRMSEIELMINSYKCSATFFPVDKALRDTHFPEIGYLNKTAYARIFIPKLINRERVLYLDTDIIVNHELLELFNQNFDDVFLALKEPDIEKILLKKNDSTLRRYFNSGVLLINTKKWNNQQITEKSLEFINKSPEKIEFADQDVLNYVCQDLWGELNRKYNYEIIYNEPNDSKDPTITHYIGNIKPWHYEYPNNVDNYIKYARLSPWKHVWKTKPTIKKILTKSWMMLKLKLKTIPGLKKNIVAIKEYPRQWKLKK